MNRRLKTIWEWLLPATDDPLLRGQAGLVVVTSLGLIILLLLLDLTWLITGDLAGETVLVGLVFSLMLAGLVALARTGRARLATWLLVGLLLAYTTLDASAFGLGSPAAAACFIPILLAACGLGLGAGLGVALYCAALVWLIATAGYAGWYEPWIAFDVSHLTFNAPFLSLFFLLAALLAGFWSRHPGRSLPR
jgi:hypothetical protein